MDDCIEKIQSLETLFSDNHYDGSGSVPFVIEAGRIPVMVSAPHAVNHFRNGRVKWADVYTGGIARYLSEATGCHVIYSCMFRQADPNFDVPEHNDYQAELIEYLSRHEVCVLMDLHGAAKERAYAVELGTAPENDPLTGVAYEGDPSLNGHDFVATTIKDVIERQLSACVCDKREVWKNVIFDAGGQNTITKNVAKRTGIACIQLEINGCYRNPQNRCEFSSLVQSLVEIIELFTSADWGIAE